MAMTNYEVSANVWTREVDVTQHCRKLEIQ